MSLLIKPCACKYILKWLKGNLILHSPFFVENEISVYKMFALSKLITKYIQIYNTIISGALSAQNSSSCGGPNIERTQRAHFAHLPRSCYFHFLRMNSLSHIPFQRHLIPYPSSSIIQNPTSSLISPPSGIQMST